MKKLILVLICISLFKTTAFATKKENLNSINIMNNKNNIEKDIEKILNNVEKFKDSFGYNDSLKKLETVNKNVLSLYNSFVKIKKILPNAIISNDTEEVISLEKYIITLISAVLLKEQISLAASSLCAIKKSSEYEKINIDLKNKIENFLKEHYKNCFDLKKYSSIIDKIFEEINLKISSVPITNRKELNNKKNKNKTKIIKKLLENELELLENKRTLMCFVEDYVNKFSEFYDSYIASDLNYKISEEFKIFLKNLFRILDIEQTYIEYFNSLINIITENGYKLTDNEIDILQETNDYFYKIKEIDEKKQDIINVMSSPVFNLSNAKEKVIYEIDLFFDSFKEKDSMIFIDSIKTLKNSLCEMDINTLKEIQELEKNDYDGDTITCDRDTLEKIRIQLTNIKNFKLKFKKPFKDIKNQIERLNLEKEYEEKIKKVEEIFNNCEKVKQYYDIHNSIVDDLKNKNKIEIEYQNQLAIAVTLWNKNKDILKSKKENFEKILKNLKYCTKDFLENEICVLDAILKDLKYFYNGKIAYSKEKVEDCYNEKTIKDFKNVVREYHTYYEFFKNARETFFAEFENLKNVSQ